MKTMITGVDHIYVLCKMKDILLLDLRRVNNREILDLLLQNKIAHVRGMSQKGITGNECSDICSTKLRRHTYLHEIVKLGEHLKHEF
jgi:hypothetical protein